VARIWDIVCGRFVEILAERGHDEIAKLPVDECGKRIGLALDDLRENVHYTPAAERDTAGQHLIQDHAETVDVGAIVDDRLAAYLFGREVGQRPDE
jgi:hypothetical protein